MKKDTQLPFMQHLDELRRRIIICSVSVIGTSIILYRFVSRLLPFIIKPVGKLVFIQPLEAFLTYIKLSFFLGIFLSMPIILYQVWSFVSVGLKVNEKRYLSFYGPVSLVFFILGAVFAYTMVMPYGIRFLLSFSSVYLQPMISVSSYISFLGVLCLAFGTAFEMPIAILFLSRIGVVNYEMLKRNRRTAIVMIFIVAAILTPPDVFTQIMMAVPLIFLYEISIFLSRLSGKANKKQC